MYGSLYLRCLYCHKIMEQLRNAARATGKRVSDGLVHVLLHHGKTRKDVYKYMYGQLVFGGKIVAPGTTIIYPESIRLAVRERFPEEGAGAYDDQYRSAGSGTNISLTTMLEFQCRAPPASCVACRTGHARGEMAARRPLPRPYR